MTFRPLHDRILVRRIEAEDKSAGGIIIPDTAKEKPSEGEVIAVGPGARDETGKLVELDVKVGDRILFGKWSGTEVKIDGEDLLIMKESDVMGVIEVEAAMRKALEEQRAALSSGAGAVLSTALSIAGTPAPAGIFVAAPGVMSFQIK